MRRKILAILASLGILLGTAAPAMAGDIGICGGNTAVYLYANYGYGGLERRYCANSLNVIAMSDLPLDMDNNAYSLKIRNLTGTGRKIVFYYNANYSGSSLTFYGDYDELNLGRFTPTFGNVITSFRTLNHP